MKFCFVRVDKIGDLVCTLPVDEFLMKTHESALNVGHHQVHWLIHQGLKPLLEHSTPQRQGTEISSQFTWAAFFQLIKWFRLEKFDGVLFFYQPWWVVAAAFFAGAPFRVGRKSQWFSYLFLSHGLRQSRSLSEKHESTYNLELYRFFEEKVFKIQSSTQLTPAPLLRLKAKPLRQLFEKWNVSAKNYVVVHAGMSGSALNWPVENYSILIEKLVNATTVVLTGTSTDQAFLSPLKDQWQHHEKVRWTVDQLKMPELLFLLENAQSVVAPSTGVAHLAASLGTPTVALYSPVLAHSKTRWGIRGPHTQILSPEPGHGMNSIKVNDVIKHLSLNENI